MPGMKTPFALMTRRVRNNPVAKIEKPGNCLMIAQNRSSPTCDMIKQAATTDVGMWLRVTGM